MPKPLKIDFVSDIACPWCVIGLGGLEAALERLGESANADIHVHPFELNPDMPAEGQNVVAHIAQKYGANAERSAATRKMIQARAAEVGFRMATNDQSRIYNTFHAHRLLHWAGLEGRQLALKHALFEAYFTQGQNPGDEDVLVEVAVKAGLDGATARDVVTSGRYAAEVRAAEQHWRRAGVNSVPAVIVNDRYLISGGQPAAAFEQALRDILAKAA
jgi:predicted DsbA family dithiol-disulfide isomerase